MSLAAPNPGQQPSKHETLSQCCVNVGPASKTMGQHYLNIELIKRLVFAAKLVTDPSNTRPQINAGLMITHRLWRWTNIEPTYREGRDTKVRA